MEEEKEINVIEDQIIKKIMLENPSLYDDLNYNEYDIKEKLEKNAYLYQQWRILWLQEKHKLKRIEILKDDYIGQLYQDLKFGDRKLGKVEIERYFIPNDKKAVKFTKLYMIQEIRCEVYEYIAESFKQQGFAMNTYVKNMSL